LGEIKDARAVPYLVEALDDKDDFVRFFAAEALGKIGDPSAVEPLMESVKNNSSAADALKRLTGEDFGTDQKDWESWWDQQNFSSPSPDS
jgi:HEAT repeat protein